MGKQYLSIDIGGSSIKYGLLDAGGRLIEHNKVSKPETLEEFRIWLNRLVQQLSGEIQGIGVCCPGKVDPETTFIDNGGAAPYLDGVTFRELLPDDLEIPVAIENDAKAATLAEIWLGRLQSEPNGVALILGTSIGGGIVLNDQLLHGVHLQAGEVGYMITDPCAVGAKEKVAGFNSSAVAMVKSVNMLVGTTDLNDGIAAFSAISSRKDAREIFTAYCKRIAQIIITLNSVVDVPIIVIGGGISVQPLVVQTINEQYDAYAAEIPVLGRRIIKPRIVPARFLNEANLYGAIYNLLLQVDNQLG